MCKGSRCRPRRGHVRCRAAYSCFVTPIGVPAERHGSAVAAQLKQTDSPANAPAHSAHMPTSRCAGALARLEHLLPAAERPGSGLAAHDRHPNGYANAPRVRQCRLLHARTCNVHFERRTTWLCSGCARRASPCWRCCWCRSPERSPRSTAAPTWRYGEACTGTLYHVSRTSVVCITVA
jgi:hypothetical protein